MTSLKLAKAQMEKAASNTVSNQQAHKNLKDLVKKIFKHKN